MAKIVIVIYLLKGGWQLPPIPGLPDINFLKLIFLFSNLGTTNPSQPEISDSKLHLKSYFYSILFTGEKCVK